MERSAVNRIFNDDEDVEGDDEMDVAMCQGNERHSVFMKLLKAANGSTVLTPTDVDEVIAYICKSTTAGEKLHEETTAAIVDLLGVTAETCDVALLKYLTTNYTRLEHHHASTQDEARTVSPTPGNKRLTLENLNPVSSELAALLGRIGEWDFDIFAVQKCTPAFLRVVTTTCMAELNLLDHTDFDEMKLESYLTEIDKSYRNNPYHNSLHAADVVQTTYHFCTKSQLIDAAAMTPLSTFSLLFAAAIHDVNHGALTNHFLVTTSASLAVQYNDHSPLENMHLATAFGILSNPAHNFMERLNQSTKKEIRRLVIAIVLATDNDRHFLLHEELEGIAGSREKASSPMSRMIHRSKRLSSGTPNSTNSACCNSEMSPESRVGLEDVGMIKLSEVRRPTAVKINTRTSTAPSPVTHTASIPHNISINQPFTQFQSVSRLKSINMRRNSVDSTPSRRQSSAGYTGNGNGSAGSLMSSSSLSGKGLAALSDTHQLRMLESILHLADVSNPAKSWNLYSRWLTGVMDEFYNQGDKERELDLPITFAFDRNNPVPQHKFQMGFIKAIVFPLFRTFSRLDGVDVSHCLRQLELNSIRWEEVAVTEKVRMFDRAVDAPGSS